MNLKVRIWRQDGPENEGKLEEYEVTDLSPFMFFLDLLDKLNEQLQENGKEPVAFDHACREANCGQCSLRLNGYPHGPEAMTTICLTRLSRFEDGETITVEPFRAGPFPVIKDLKIDRGSLEKVIEAGGYMRVKSSHGFISIETGEYVPPPKGGAGPVNQRNLVVDPSACITCGACVASCRNGAAMLFTSAKLAQLNAIEEDEIERHRRTLNMVRSMDENGFGACSVDGNCAVICPKGLSMDLIAKMNRDYFKASLAEIRGKIPKKAPPDATNPPFPMPG